MNELEYLTGFRDGAPRPTDAETASARARLMAAVADSAGTGSSGIELSGRGRRRTAWRRMAVTLVTTAALVSLLFTPPGAALAERFVNMIVPEVLIGDDGDLAGTNRPHPGFSEVASDGELDRFSVLGSPVVEFSDLPASLKNSIGAVLTPRQMTGIRVGRVELSGGTVVVAGNHRLICLAEMVDGGGGSTCSPVSETLSGGLSIATACAVGVSDGRVRIVGIAPDGVGRVEIDGGNDGQVDRRVAVVGNVYVAKLAPLPTTITSRDRLTPAFRTQLPLDQWAVAPGKCDPSPGGQR